MICKECGVELDDKMEECPLCRMHVSSRQGADYVIGPADDQQTTKEKRHVLGQVLWQITSVLLISGIASTLIINLSIKGTVSWSVYPMCICLILLSYAALMSLWKTHSVLRILAAWTLSTIFLLILDYFLDSDWPTALAFPILCALNIGVLVVMILSRSRRKKGLNYLALIFLIIALFCLVIDGIITLYLGGRIYLSWSIIVAACLVPVTGTILYMYFKMKNNVELEKIFHI
jgi:hypothetical protein